MTFLTTGAQGWLAVLATVFALANGASPAVADELYCSQSQPSGVAEITGAGRAYFHHDADMCPGHKAYCLGRAYVVPGDRVLTGVSQDGYTCVWMPGTEQTTADWIETGRLRQQPISSSPASSAWVGDWRSEDVAKIVISSDKSGLLLFAAGVDDWNSGDGYNDDGTIALPGRNHHAEFSGRLRTEGNQARLEDGDCVVKFALLAEFMIVEDDTSCDPNTSFRGAFRKVRRKAG